MSLVSIRLTRQSILSYTTLFRSYIGISEEPASRLAQHNQGLSKWTSRHRPWDLVHVEPYANYAEARKREIALKKQKDGAGFYALTGLNPARSKHHASGS